jgi:hypothetical protein
MSYTDIAKKVSLFNPAETIISDFSKVNMKGALKWNMRIPKNKNVIFILNGVVMDEIDFRLTSVSQPDANDEIVQQQQHKLLNGNYIPSATEGAINAIAGLIDDPKLMDSLVLYYPYLSQTPNDPRWKFSQDGFNGGEMALDIMTFNDLVVPEGKGMVLIFPKNTITIDLTIRIKRPSYMSQICKPCVAHETESESESESETHCDTKGKIDQRIFWGVTAGLLVLLLIIISACCSYTYNIKKSQQSSTAI